MTVDDARGLADAKLTMARHETMVTHRAAIEEVAGVAARLEAIAYGALMVHGGDPELSDDLKQWADFRATLNAMVESTTHPEMDQIIAECAEYIKVTEASFGGNTAPA